MNKNMVVRFASASVVAAMAVAMSAQAFAIDWNPSRTQSEVSVPESTTTTTTGTTVEVTASPTVDPSTGAVQQVQDTAAPVIQVTPVSETLAANAAINQANPGATGEQLAGLPTDSGLSYGDNGQLNNLYNQVQNAESVDQLLQDTAPQAAAEFEAVAGAPAAEYTPIAMYDIATSPAAARAIEEAGSVQVTIAVPGVANGTQAIAICWNRAGSSRTVPVTVSGGNVRLTVTSSGPVMIMVRNQAPAQG